eukprot:g2721.t1
MHCAADKKKQFKSAFSADITQKIEDKVEAAKNLDEVIDGEKKKGGSFSKKKKKKKPQPGSLSPAGELIQGITQLAALWQ